MLYIRWKRHLFKSKLQRSKSIKIFSTTNLRKTLIVFDNRRIINMKKYIQVKRFFSCIFRHFENNASSLELKSTFYNLNTFTNSRLLTLPSQVIAYSISSRAFIASSKLADDDTLIHDSRSFGFVRDLVIVCVLKLVFCTLSPGVILIQTFR